MANPMSKLQTEFNKTTSPLDLFFSKEQRVVDAIDDLNDAEEFANIQHLADDDTADYLAQLA